MQFNDRYRETGRGWACACEGQDTAGPGTDDGRGESIGHVEQM
jgi:hypothetical protein